MIDKEQVLDLIPHRPPFLWIDRIAELEAGVRCVALKFVDPAEPIFAGHFPGNAILPGVLIIEAAAQTAGVMLGCSNKETSSHEGREAAGGNPLLAAVNRFKFMKSVRPGSELRIETKRIAELGHMAYVAVIVWVDGEKVASGELAVTS